MHCYYELVTNETDFRRRLHMATILDALTGNSPEPPTPETAGFDPERKLVQMVNSVRELTGIELARSEDGALMFALKSGEQFRCEVQDRYQMLFSATVMPMDSEQLKEAAPAILNANAFGKITKGGWLAWDFSTGSLLFHYVWSDFAIASPEAFLTLVRLLANHAGELRAVISDGTLTSTLQQVSDQLFTNDA